jgi:hypothetical protein
MKYLLMATSSNFGNMFSMAGVMLFLPFLRMLPTQILLNNFLYRRAFQHPQHFITNHQLAINDDGTATGYTNWFVVQSREEQSYCGWGSYEWEFRHTDGLWKMSRMLITLNCMTTLERGWGMLAGPILPFPRGSNGRTGATVPPQRGGGTGPAHSAGRGETSGRLASGHRFAYALMHAYDSDLRL